MIKESLPWLIEGIKGDGRNVILSLARMWQTVSIDEISLIDVAAEWALPWLPKEYSTLLNLARKAYREEYVDRWEGLDFIELAGELIYIRLVPNLIYRKETNN